MRRRVVRHDFVESGVGVGGGKDVYMLDMAELKESRNVACTRWVSVKRPEATGPDSVHNSLIHRSTQDHPNHAKSKAHSAT